ncbi:MAG TPA: 2-dehydro-3-deoxy-6-phosphogalactonate aldolase [Caulobacteraceae bacterium]|jgi:2-dehydro-3-deoxyphosphogalactonate aldolase
MTPDEALAEAPVVAIIRGVQPEEAEAVAEAVHAAGIRAIEVPMNSPRPLESIRRLADAWGGRMAVGGGTLLHPDQVRAVADAGGKIAVSPNTNPAVIRAALDLGLEPMPGFTTPTEAFAALAAGARRLKLFPAGSLGPAHLKAVKEVLPPEATVYAVGGVKPDAFGDWWAAGAVGFGMGGELYKAGRSASEVAERARAVMAAMRPLLTSAPGVR